MNALVHLGVVSVQLMELLFKLHILADFLLLLDARMFLERRIRLDKCRRALCGLGQLSMKQRQSAFSLG